MSEPGAFRLTRFDDRGPVGHSVTTSLRAACLMALQEHYHPSLETPR